MKAECCARYAKGARLREDSPYRTNNLGPLTTRLKGHRAVDPASGPLSSEADPSWDPAVGAGPLRVEREPPDQALRLPARTLAMGEAQAAGRSAP